MTTLHCVHAGERSINGTLFPIHHEVVKDTTYGKVKWILYKYVCNGTSVDAIVFKTKKAALCALEELG
jgi:hypothetical protein